MPGKHLVRVASKVRKKKKKLSRGAKIGLAAVGSVAAGVAAGKVSDKFSAKMRRRKKRK